MSACDIIENWDETAFSGEGGRLDQLGDLINDTMESYGFEGVDVEESPGLMDSEGVPAQYDPNDNTIYFDPDYFASDEITADEAINIAIHESIHAMDMQEDGMLDIGETGVVDAAFGMSGDATDGCSCEPPESGSKDGSDTGGW